NYADGAKIQFNKFNFFVSEIALISAGTDESKTELIEIDKIDLSFDLNNQAQAEEGVTLTIKDLPVGNYSGINIGFGVSADLNRTKPTDYGTGHPLKSNYWDGWSSYIFSVIEGGYDMNNDGQILLGGSESEGFTYHSGTDDLYTSGFVAQNIELSADQVGQVNLKIDVEKLFRNNNPEFDTNGDGYLDIELFSGSHTDAQLEIARQIMSNFNNAISL
ncbi:MAG: MbnP family protein, partial [Bacteroidota bacterium]